MPRRPALVKPDIPLFFISSVIRQEIKKAGEELERIVVKKAGRHFYNLAIHTRSVSRELRAGVMRVGVPECGGAGA
jgi:hypothetical protein